MDNDLGEKQGGNGSIYGVRFLYGDLPTVRGTFERLTRAYLLGRIPDEKMKTSTQAFRLIMDYMKTEKSFDIEERLARIEAAIEGRS